MYNEDITYTGCKVTIKTATGSKNYIEGGKLKKVSLIGSDELSNYTIPQLKDEFDRFILKQNFDIYLKARLAGAQDLEEVKNWMEDL